MSNNSYHTPTFDTPLPIASFLETRNTSYLYDDLRQFEHFFYSYLEKNNLTNGPIGLHLSSSDELLFLIAACWRLGIPFIPFNPAIDLSSMSTKLRELKVPAVISDGRPKDFNSNIQLLDIDEFKLSNILQPDFNPDKQVKQRKESLSPDRIWSYLLTSGTTGPPKAVPLKRRQMLFAAQASAQNIRPVRNGLWLLCMPLHHIGGISVIIRSLLYGSGIYRMPKFDGKAVTQLFGRNERLQAASLVPTMLKRLLERADFEASDYFQAILLGGGPIREPLVDECFNRGIPIITSYGMTESCAQIAANPLMTVGDLSRPKKSVGRIFPPNEIEIRKPSGKALPMESGQIWLRGPQIFDGYMQDKKNDEAAFDENGWFNTKDVGYLNKKEELFIETRRTDLIISGGENIIPSEVEEALESLSLIKKAVVVGIEDEEWGQKAVALIITQSDDISFQRDEFKNKLPNLESYKIPKAFIQVDSIPKTATNKVKREEAKTLALNKMG